MPEVSPAPPSDTIVPYLLTTTIATGGDFFFVDKSQIGLTAEVLLAQIDQQTGAGAGAM
ncbi:MAG: hypothetical protein R2873_22480 [Caldilineaceae bacterium]